MLATGITKQTDLGLNLATKRKRRRAFLAQMARVTPWAELVELITLYAPEGAKGGPPFSMESMLLIHSMRRWFTLSDPSMKESLHDLPLF